jgi:hypothetical protein
VPNVRDDRDTPLMRAETAMDIVVIWVCEKAEYFFARDWTTQISLKLLDKLDFW